MASPLKATVTGRKAVLEALRAVGAAADAIVVEAVLIGGMTFRDEVHRRAPVGDGTKRPAGTLKSKIRANLKKKRGYVSSHVITPPEAVFPEYGFLHARSGKRIAPKPFIRPAFEAKAPQVEQDALAFMAAKLEAVAAREANPDA